MPQLTIRTRDGREVPARATRAANGRTVLVADPDAAPGAPAAPASRPALIDYPTMRPGTKPAATGQPISTATATATDRQPGPVAWQYPTMNPGDGRRGDPVGVIAAPPGAAPGAAPGAPAAAGDDGTAAPADPPPAAAGDEPPAAGDDTTTDDTGAGDDTGGTAAGGSVLAQRREQLEQHVNRERERRALFTPADVDAEIERRIEAGELARPDGGNGDAGDGE